MAVTVTRYKTLVGGERVEAIDGGTTGVLDPETGRGDRRGAKGRPHLPASDHGDPVVQISPPLAAGQEEFDRIFAILGDVLSEAWEELRRR